jgi:hypothetical protein
VAKTGQTLRGVGTDVRTLESDQSRTSLSEMCGDHKLDVLRLKAEGTTKSSRTETGNWNREEKGFMARATEKGLTRL